MIAYVKVCLVLFRRPNVCAYRDVDVVMAKKPCNKTYSRLVKVWRPNCGGRPNNWCLGYEKRSVLHALRLIHRLLC